VDCKKKLLERLLPDQERLREKREALLARPDYVKDVVREGNARARAEAARTMDEVRTAMHLDQNL
jgi:tryptophanyl-tRNA synthetase